MCLSRSTRLTVAGNRKKEFSFLLSYKSPILPHSSFALARGWLQTLTKAESQQVFLKKFHSHESRKENILFERSVTSKETTVSIFICIVQALDVVQLH